MKERQGGRVWGVGRGGGVGEAEQQSVKAGEASPPPSNLRRAVYSPPSFTRGDNCHGGEGGVRAGKWGERGSHWST